MLRRLIRRAVRYGMGIGMPEGFTGEMAKVIIDQYKDVYPELRAQRGLRPRAAHPGGGAASPRTLKQGMTANLKSWWQQGCRMDSHLMA